MTEAEYARRVSVLRDAIRDARKAHIGSPNLQRYPEWVPSAARDILDFDTARGKSASSVAKLLGVSTASLFRWASMAHPLPAKPTRPGAPMTRNVPLLTGPDHVDRGHYTIGERCMITVTTPRGIKIEGLSLDQCIRFVVAVERGLIALEKPT